MDSPPVSFPSIVGVPFVRPENLGSMRQGHQYVIAQKFMRHPIKSRSQVAIRQPFQPRDYVEFQALAFVPFMVGRRAWEQERHTQGLDRGRLIASSAWS